MSGVVNLLLQYLGLSAYSANLSADRLKPDMDVAVIELHKEQPTRNIKGSEVLTSKTTSFSVSQQGLYAVDGMIVSDISYISPADVIKIEFVDDALAAEYGMRGADGVLKITLRKE